VSEPASDDVNTELAGMQTEGPSSTDIYTPEQQQQPRSSGRPAQPALATQKCATAGNSAFFYAGL